MYEEASLPEHSIDGCQIKILPIACMPIIPSKVQRVALLSVVAGSFCNTCTNVTKSKAVILYNLHASLLEEN